MKTFQNISGADYPKNDFAWYDFDLILGIKMKSN